MTFLIKRAYGPLVVLLCALSSSYAYSKALPDNKGKVSCSEDYECDFSNEPKVVDWMFAEEAYTAGEDTVKCVLKYCISLGQGNFFQDLKEMLVKGYALRDSIERIGSFGPESNLKQAFVKGLVSQLEKENVHEFVKQARFAEWQKKFVIDVWNVALKDLRVLGALEQSSWKKYRNDHLKEDAAFMKKMWADIRHELLCGKN